MLGKGMDRNPPEPLHTHLDQSQQLMTREHLLNLLQMLLTVNANHANK